MNRKLLLNSIRKGINIFVLFALISINAIPASTQPVFAQGNPSFSVRLTENQVHGYEWPLGTEVTMSIDGTPYGPETVVVANWDPNQTFVWFDAGGVTLQAGQLIEMTDGTVTKTHTVTSLVVDGVDPIADTVYGRANPGSQIDIGHIYCDENGCFGFRREIADGNGNWLADFSVPGEDGDEQDLFDIQPGTNSEARQCDNEGNCTQYGWYVPNPTFSARKTENQVHGYEWPLGADVTLTIDGNNMGTRTVGVADWNPSQTFVGFDVPLQEGQIIEMSDGNVTKSHTVTNLVVTGVNPDNDTVYGTADPGAQVNVGHIYCDENGCFGFRREIADANGDWVADFSVPGEDNDEQDIIDIQPGIGSEARQCDNDGDCSQYGWSVSDPRVEVSYEHDWIQIRDFTPGGEVTYTIFDYEGGHALFGPVTGPVDSHGDGWISYNLHHTDLIPGNYITAVNETTGEEVSILIRDLNLDYIGVNDDRAFGTAEPNTTIEMHISETHDQGFNLNINVDAAGYWEVDLVAEGYPINSYRHASIYLYDAEGDNIVAQPPRLHGATRSDNISVDNFSKNADVTLTLYDSPGGNVLYGPDTIRSDGSGNVWVSLWPYGIDLIPGNYIVAYDHHLDFTKSLEIEPFTIDGMNAAEDYVYGTSVVGEWVELHVESLFSNWGLDALTDGNGNWFRDYGLEDYDITDQMWTNGWATDNEDNWSEDYTTGLPNIEASIVDDWISGFNFSPDRQVRISFYTAESGSLIKTFLVTARGNTQFQANYWDHGVDLQAGMYLLVEDLETGKYSELTLVPLTFDGVDYDADTVWGRADPGAQVVVRANQLFESYEFTAIADGSGNWLADFSSYGADLTPEWNIRALVFDLEFDATVADAPRPPQLTASVDGDWVSGENWTPDQSVSINVYESESGPSVGSTTTRTTDNYGSFYAELGNVGVDLLPGYHIVVEDNYSGVIKSITLPNLTIDYIDPVLDIAGGQAPPDTRLSIDFNNQQESIQFDLFSESNGTWEADFAAHDFDLQPGSQGNVRLTDEDGDATQVDGYVPNPNFSARLTENQVHGYEWILGTDVTLFIDGNEISTQTVTEADWDPNQTFVWFDLGESLTLQAGQFIEMTDGTITKSHTVTSLDVTGIDPDADTVFGIADAESQINVGISCEDCPGRNEIADASGNWVADYSVPGDENWENNTFDIQPGQWGEARECDNDGDCTQFEWHLPNPTFAVRVNSNWIEANEWELGTSLTLEINDPDNGPGVDYTDTQTVGEAPWDPSQTYVEIQFDGLYDVQPGDVATLTDGVASKTHIVTSIEITGYDLESDLVFGNADPDSYDLLIYACNNENCSTRHVDSDGGGYWTADFGNPGAQDDEQDTYDIIGGTWLDSQQGDEDGDFTFFGVGVPNPTFGVRVNYGGIEGWEWPLGAIVTIEIDDPTTSEDPDPLTATVGVADWDPNQTYFSLNIENYDLKTGDTVIVTDGNTTKELTITHFEITGYNLDTEMVYGEAGENQYINVWTCWQDEPCIGRDENANENGDWSTNFAVPGEQGWEGEIADLQPGSWIDSSVSDEDGDQILFGVSVPFNQSPTDVVITAPTDPLPVNDFVPLQVDFNDPDANDDHTVVIDWGDMTTTNATVTGLTAVAVHQYQSAGVYTINVTVTDTAGKSAQATYQYVVIYDPAGGFVTGGGWIDSPVGAYTADPSLTGKATFGFVSKYKKGADVPTGNTEFQFKAGNLNFHSTSYDWLVIAGNKAQFKGEGTINGEGNYKFMLWADDDDPDTFRIQIWGDNGNIYDNGSKQGLGGGSIVVHKGK